jgi:hypothetical protein
MMTGVNMPLREAGPLGPSPLVKRLLNRYRAFSVDCREKPELRFYDEA